MPTYRALGPVLFAALVALVSPDVAAQASVMPGNPGLTGLVAPRGAELTAAGIHRVVARDGQGATAILVLSAWGPIYFGWPRGVAPATFELDVGSGGAVSVAAPPEGDRARYAAAIDAVLTEAVRRVGEARTLALRPRP